MSSLTPSSSASVSAAAVSSCVTAAAEDQHAASKCPYPACFTTKAMQHDVRLYRPPTKEEQDAHNDWSHSRVGEAADNFQHQYREHETKILADFVRLRVWRHQTEMNLTEFAVDFELIPSHAIRVVALEMCALGWNVVVFDKVNWQDGSKPHGYKMRFTQDPINDRDRAVFSMQVGESQPRENLKKEFVGNYMAL
jgi:hypothetical protein